MKPLIRRILREQTDPTFSDKVWAAVKGVGKFALKNNSLSWLIKTLVGATPTKARLIFPKEGWETAAVEILEQIGIVTGTYKTLSEANEFFKDLKENDIILEELLIGSHGSPGTLLVTSEGRFYHEKKWVSLDNGEVNAMGEPEGEMVLTGKKIPISKSYGFRTEFLKHIKPVVNSNTKVYFTACHGAEKLGRVLRLTYPVLSILDNEVVRRRWWFMVTKSYVGINQLKLTQTVLMIFM